MDHIGSASLASCQRWGYYPALVSTYILRQLPYVNKHLSDHHVPLHVLDSSTEKSTTSIWFIHAPSVSSLEWLVEWHASLLWSAFYILQLVNWSLWASQFPIWHRLGAELDSSHETKLVGDLSGTTQNVETLTSNLLCNNFLASNFSPSRHG